jgi:hypothetical protein
MVENESEPDPLAARKALTFAQAEGVAPLPAQMARGQISNEFRAVLWAWLKHEFQKHRVDTPIGHAYLRKPDPVGSRPRLPSPPAQRIPGRVQ